MKCRCGHDRKDHFHGICIADAYGGTCECAKFVAVGTRAKYGKSKRDLLSRYTPSIDAPVRSCESDGVSVGSMIGADDAKLCRVEAGEQSPEFETEDFDRRMRETFIARGNRNGQRDLQIWDRHHAGESLASISRDIGVTPAAIFVVISTIKTHQFSLIKQGWRDAARRGVEVGL